MQPFKYSPKFTIQIYKSNIVNIRMLSSAQDPSVSDLIQHQSSQMAIAIQSMRSWLQDYSLQKYEALLVQQSQLYAQMQKSIKKNESQLSNLKLKEQCKQNLTDKILEYNFEIEKLTARIRERQSQEIQNKELRKVQEADALDLQNKKQKIRSNQKEKKSNIEKVRYLKEKIIRVYKQINFQTTQVKELQYQVQKRKIDTIPITKNHSQTYTQASAPKPERHAKIASEEKWLENKIVVEGQISQRLSSIE